MNKPVDGDLPPIPEDDKGAPCECACTATKADESESDAEGTKTRNMIAVYWDINSGESKPSQ
jgi:hypothetical protein